MTSDATVDQDVFEIGDTATWRHGWDSRSSIGRSGPGPFVVQHVSAMEVDCLCQGHPHHYPASPDCPNKSTPAHPQMVTIGDPETGEFLNILSGGHLKKVILD